MKKILLTLTTVLMASFAMAQTEFTWTWDQWTGVTQVGTTQDGYPSTEGSEQISFEKDGFSIVANKGKASSVPVVNGTNNDLRTYANGTFTVKNTKEMTGLLFTISAQGKKRLTDLTPSTGTMKVNASDGVVSWVGNAAEVTFTVGEKAVHGTDGNTKAGQFDFDKIALYTDGASPEVGDATIIENTPETAYTTTEAIAIIDAGKGLEQSVYVKGTIKEITDISWDASLATGYYGNATYTITDGTSDLIIYRGYYLKGEKFTEENQIQDGDEVIVYGKLVNFKGTKEMTTGSSIYSINGDTGEVEEEPYDVVGNGTIENPYNAEDVVWLFKHEQAPTENVWVKGTILGNVNTSNGNTQVPTVWEIEDNNGDGKIDQKDCAEGDFLVLPSNLSVGNDKAHVAVQLTYETAPRNALNLQDHKENLGKDVWVCGKIEKYCNVAGVKSLVDYSFDGTAGINNVNVIVNDNIYNIAGQRVANNYRGIIIMNGKKYIK